MVAIFAHRSFIVNSPLGYNCHFIQFRELYHRIHFWFSSKAKSRNTGTMNKKDLNHLIVIFLNNEHQYLKNSQTQLVNKISAWNILNCVKFDFRSCLHVLFVFFSASFVICWPPQPIHYPSVYVFIWNFLRSCVSTNCLMDNLAQLKMWKPQLLTLTLKVNINSNFWSKYCAQYVLCDIPTAK